MMMCKPIRILCALLAAFVMFAAIPVAAAETIDTRTLATINKPGTVLVLTTWTADMRLHEFSLDDSLWDDITKEVTRMVKKGEIASDEATLYSVILQLMAANMHNYAFYTGNVSDKKVGVQAMGSGFIVTPDGYLVTNAHVVQDDEDTLYQYFAVSNLQEQADTDISEMLAEMRRTGYNPSQEELDAIYNAYFNLLAQSFELSNLQANFDCVLGNVTPGSDITVKGINMDLRKIGEPYPGKDVAILKIDGQTNLPTVTLGDDTTMKTGDKVYAMGYPGAATLHDSVNINQSMQEPTLTQGIISAKKQMTGGWNIIQMDAAIHYGNSGGPLFNEAGEVIGINTFGSVDNNSGTLVSGMNFAIPISIAKQFLNEINVTPVESTFTTNFKKALTAYNAGDYKTALDLLHGINDTNPGFPIVQELLAEARVAYDANPQPETPAPTDADKDNGAASVSGKAVQTDSDKAPGFPPIVIYILIGLVVIGIAVTLIIVLGKKKKAGAYGAQGQYIPPSGPTGYLHQAPPAPNMGQPPAPSMGPRCSKCGAPLNPGAKFCNECGQVNAPPAPTSCPQCNAPLGQGARFCNECGYKIN